MSAKPGEQCLVRAKAAKSGLTLRARHGVGIGSPAEGVVLPDDRLGYASRAVRLGELFMAIETLSQLRPGDQTQCAA